MLLEYMLAVYQLYLYNVHFLIHLLGPTYTAFWLTTEEYL